MSTAEAITALREKMGLTQHQLADRLGVTITSISRYENGREPNRQVLKDLAEAAESAGLIPLRDIFGAKWKAGIIARIKNLPSAGTQRRVPLDDLKRWQGMTRHVVELVQHLQKGYTDVISRYRISPADQQVVQACHRNMWSLATDLLPGISKSIEPYINEPAPAPTPAIGPEPEPESIVLAKPKRRLQPIRFQTVHARNPLRKRKTNAKAK